MLAALVYIVVTSGGELGGGETSSDSGPINVTIQKGESFIHLFLGSPQFLFFNGGLSIVMYFHGNLQILSVGHYK
jgi:hypothetical protein